MDIEKRGKANSTPEYNRLWRAKNPEKARANRKRSYQRLRGCPNTWAKIKAMRIRNKLRRDGLPPDITHQDILDAIPADNICPALGVKLAFGTTLARKWDGPSVDKIDPRKGYVRGNLCVISYRANAIKQDCTDPNDLRRIADYMEKALARSLPAGVDK